MKLRKQISKIGIMMVGLALGIIAVAAIAAPAKTTGDAAPATPADVIITPMAMTNTVSGEPMIVTLEYRATEDTQPPAIQTPSEADIEMLAKLVWGEARGVNSKTQQAAVIWCVLNRVDSTGYACGKSIAHVVTFPNQFQGYNANYPATDEFKALAEDVLTRWYAEKAGYINIGRVLPVEYQWFMGNGSTNTFRNAYTNGAKWDWSLESPYES